MVDSPDGDIGAIERGELDGKQGWIVWLDALGWPTTKERSGRMRIDFDGGGSATIQLEHGGLSSGRVG